MIIAIVLVTSLLSYALGVRVGDKIGRINKLAEDLGVDNKSLGRKN